LGGVQLYMNTAVEAPNGTSGKRLDASPELKQDAQDRRKAKGDGNSAQRVDHYVNSVVLLHARYLGVRDHYSSTMNTL
jgi:hypothetical protein